MSETERIVEQLKRAFVGNAWHGPAVMEILEGVTAEQAMARPFEGAHSIWELALHIEAWTRACRSRLQGQRAELSEAEDWPAVIGSDEEGWKRVRESIQEAHDELAAAIKELEDSRLDQPIVKGMSSVYITLHGMIQHSLYHAGQIAILKKEFSERQTA